MDPSTLLKCVQSVQSTVLSVSSSQSPSVAHEAVSFLCKNDLDHDVQFLQLWLREVSASTPSAKFLVQGIRDALGDVHRELSSLHTVIHKRRTSWWWARVWWHDPAIRRHLEAVRFATLRLHHRVETLLRMRTAGAGGLPNPTNASGDS